METNVASNPGVPRKRIEYQYDSESRRIARAELAWSGTSFTPDPAPVRYIWRGWNLLAEGITSGSTIAVKKSYLWGLDLNETLDQTGNVGNLLAIVDQSGVSTVNLLPSYDGNGNIIALSHAGTGQRIASYEYDAFGQRVVSTNHAALLNQSAAISTAVASNRWGFSTKQEDAATGFLYYGYRYYDPATGRWPSKDPIGERGGINLYGFVKNYGVGSCDLLGLANAKVKVTYIPPDATKITPEVAATGGSGTTYHDIKVTCSCVCPTEGKKDAFMKCEVSFTAKIKVSQAQAKEHGVDLSQIYGHEQRHVLSRTERVQKTVVDPLKKETGEFNTLSSCNNRKSKYEKEYLKKLESELDPNSGFDDHDDDDNTLSPGDGKPYPPLPGSPEIRK